MSQNKILLMVFYDFQKKYVVIRRNSWNRTLLCLSLLRWTSGNTWGSNKNGKIQDKLDVGLVEDEVRETRLSWM